VNSDVADAAIKLARGGHPVLPLHSIARAGRCTCGRSCASPGKHPRLLHGLKEASAEPAVVAAWWRRWKLANLGLVTGHGGLFVLDVDGAEGEDTLAQLEAEHGPLPLTRWVRTGSGGRHAYFRSQEHLGNSCRRVGPGLDGRGKGGYVLVPPSVHVSGTAYSWMNQDRAAQLPRWLLELLRPPAPPSPAPTSRIGRPRGDYGRAALAGEEAMVRMSIPGSRNHRLNAAAFSLGQLVGAGMLDVNEVAGTLLGAAQAAGLSEIEAQRTIASGLTAGQRHPRERTA
jgi:hypothetical protein